MCCAQVTTTVFAVVSRVVQMQYGGPATHPCELHVAQLLRSCLSWSVVGDLCTLSI